MRQKYLLRTAYKSYKVRITKSYFRNEVYAEVYQNGKCLIKFVVSNSVKEVDKLFELDSKNYVTSLKQNAVDQLSKLRKYSIYNESSKILLLLKDNSINNKIYRVINSMYLYGVLFPTIFIYRFGLHILICILLLFIIFLNI